MTGMIVATGMSGAWIGVALGIVVLLVCSAPVLWLCWRFVAMDDDAFECAVEDVQRFVELTDQARLELAATPRLPLFDPAGAAATRVAIERFIVRKDLARRALFREPLSLRPQPAAASESPPRFASAKSKSTGSTGRLGGPSATSRAARS
jgi:hypothetical protein